MNRRTEETIDIVPEFLKRGWEKMHPLMGATFTNLRQGCLDAEKSMKSDKGIAIVLGILVYMLVWTVAEDFVGEKVNVQSFKTLFFVVTAGLVLDGIMVMSILSSCKKHRKTVELYERALPEFENSIDMIVSGLGVTRSYFQHMSPAGLEQNINRLAGEVISTSRKYRECIQKEVSGGKDNVTAVVVAGQAKELTRHRLDQVLKELRSNFGIQIDEDGCFETAKKQFNAKQSP